MDAIRCEHLTKIYPKVTAVNDVNLTVPQGELFALLGMGDSDYLCTCCGCHSQCQHKN